jgi:hypothetical protein
MKNIFIILVIMCSNLLIQAQSDIIYTTENGKIIFDCKIIEVQYGNMVYYLKDTVQNTVEALMITKDGVNIKLTKFDVNTKSNDELPTTISGLVVKQEPKGMFEGKHYNYYLRTYKSAKHKRNFGIILAVVGFTATAAGMAMSMNYLNTKEQQETATGVYIGGIIVHNLGMLLWISGAVKTSNNRKAMEIAKANLSFGPTNNGIGFTLAFY